MIQMGCVTEPSGRACEVRGDEDYGPETTYDSEEPSAVKSLDPKCGRQSVGHERHGRYQHDEEEHGKVRRDSDFEPKGCEENPALPSRRQT